MSNPLTVKELEALNEELGSEQLMVKRCRAAADACGEQALRDHFTQMADRHQKHYDTLVTFLS